MATATNYDQNLLPLDSASNRARIRVSQSAIVRNLKTLSCLCNGIRAIPMLKANAYGHGLIAVAKLLEKDVNTYALGVATLSEAVLLRKQNVLSKIIVFSDASPWSEEKQSVCQRHSLTPVFSTLSDLKVFLDSQTKIPFQVEVNTGMNRLGVPVDALSNLNFIPEGIFSHFAESDEPLSSLTKLQLKNFDRVRAWRKEKAPNAELHFANSGGAVFFKKLGLKDTTLFRPGISLYGISPKAKVKVKDLVPAMTFEAPVFLVQRLKKNDRVGYSGTYKVKSHEETILTLGAGYGDGVHRSLSNRGHVSVMNKALPIVGRVSMDLTTVRGKAKVGSFVELWGKKLDAWTQALSAGTIPYELFTSVSERVERIYEP